MGKNKPDCLSKTCLMPASLSAVHSCASDRNPPSFRQQVLNITNTISRVFSRVTSTLGFLKSIPKRCYFSECKHKQKKSCVLDLNDALLRLYLPPKNRNE